MKEGFIAATRTHTHTHTHMHTHVHTHAYIHTCTHADFVFRLCVVCVVCSITEETHRSRRCSLLTAARSSNLQSATAGTRLKVDGGMGGGKAQSHHYMIQFGFL